MTLAILLLTGCRQPCEGATCADLYPRSRLRVYAGTTLGGASTLDAPAAEAWGDAALLGDWALVGLGEDLYVGLPAVDQVRRLGADDVATGALPELAVGDGAPAGAVFGAVGGAQFGAAVDVRDEGDGTSSFVVGAPGLDAAIEGQAVGGVWAWEGLAAPLAGEVLAVDAPLAVGGTAPQGRLGSRVVACTDLDGDGAGDFLATAAWGEEGGTLAGDVSLVTASAVEVWPGPGDAAVYGHAAWCGGDLDGDGAPDVVLGAPGAVGERGLTSGVVQLRSGASLGSVATTLSGSVNSEAYGYALALGDLDGDGRADLAVGAPGANAPGGENDVAGAVSVYFGRRPLSGGLAVVFGPDPDVTLRGADGRGRLGSALLVVDLDQDGVGDLVAGAPGVNPGGEPATIEAGAVYAWFGGPAAWAGRAGVDDADVALVGDRQFLRVGAVIAAADLDGVPGPDLVLTTAEPE